MTQPRTAPPGPRDRAGRIVADKSRTPAMFNTIARRYDLLNHLLSLNADRRWRRALVERAGVADGGRVLDVATGTGDVAIEFARRTRAGEITGLDPSAGMLAVGRDKIARAGLEGRVRLMEGNALELPFEDGTFDVVAIAFGLRNLPDYARGVREMARVLRPGGRLLVLEFLPPTGATKLLFHAYIGTVLPVVGRVVSGSPEAYAYLAASIHAFMTAETVRGLMTSAGLEAVATRRLTLGVAGLHEGVRR